MTGFDLLGKKGKARGYPVGDDSNIREPTEAEKRYIGSRDSHLLDI